MRTRHLRTLVICNLVGLVGAILLMTAACKEKHGAAPRASSGARKASVTVKTAANGNTLEQNNIVERLKRDNQPGSIKHLYVISTVSGQVLMYSTVKGKVTSSGKRLSPASVAVEYDASDDSFAGGFAVDIGGDTLRTAEVLGDDGTYGSSIEYLYWFDARDVYHQHYLAGDQMVHITDTPMSFKTIVINMEAEAAWGGAAASPPAER